METSMVETTTVLSVWLADKSVLFVLHVEGCRYRLLNENVIDLSVETAEAAADLLDIVAKGCNPCRGMFLIALPQTAVDGGVVAIKATLGRGGGALDLVSGSPTKLLTLTNDWSREACLQYLRVLSSVRCRLRAADAEKPKDR
jgi:hypothetical protein